MRRKPDGQTPCATFPALQNAIVRKGWSINHAAKVAGIGQQTLYNLLGRGSLPPTKPDQVKVVTMVRLLYIFDELAIDDFCSPTISDEPPTEHSFDDELVCYCGARWSAKNAQSHCPVNTRGAGE